MRERKNAHPVRCFDPGSGALPGKTDRDVRSHARGSAAGRVRPQCSLTLILRNCTRLEAPFHLLLLLVVTAMMLQGDGVPPPGTPGSCAFSMTVVPLRTTVSRSPFIVISKVFHSPTGLSALRFRVHSGPDRRRPSACSGTRTLRRIRSASTRYSPGLFRLPRR